MTADRSVPARQLPLALSHRVAMTRADFLVGAANSEAIGLIDRWPEWPEAGVLLVGPAGSGKSHLVEIWRSASHATRLAAVELDEERAEALAGAPVAVEDLQAGEIDERALFHLLNLARERKIGLLLTSQAPPGQLGFGLADLASRLRAVRPVELAEPDDDLLRRVLIKLFADRQLGVDAGVVDYLATRIERSLAAANTIVARLDEEGLAKGRAVTRQFAGEVLERMFPEQADLWPEAE